MGDEYAGCEVSIYNVTKPSEVVDCNISLTEKAATTLTQMAKDENHIKWQLYINVVGGGCSGYLYDVQILDKDPSDLTQVIISQDIEIVIKQQDSTLLNEIEIDWDDSLMGGGLKFRNPNATKTCSCGISFK
jgi:iron-sulfur cluster assembly accessory protein|tara:strand:- start:4635 stop:5030 length:396 start_codon:yes stop_codon:yes gene_type:complete